MFSGHPGILFFLVSSIPGHQSTVGMPVHTGDPQLKKDSGKMVVSMVRESGLPLLLEPFNLITVFLFSRNLR